MSKNYINYHILISHSPSCLNRDDMNMQKSAIFGGVRRVRVSSQSFKRALRMSEYYERCLGQPSKRTRDLSLLVNYLGKKLSDRGIDRKWINIGIKAFTDKLVENDDDEGDSEKSNKVAVAPWSLNEIALLCKTAQKVYESQLSDKEQESLSKAIEKESARKATAKKPKLSDDQVKEQFLTKKIQKELEEQSEALRKACCSAVDIALSGRMATSGLMTSVDGALAVAHSITTHAMEADIDWFTAVDDLVSDEGDVGAGHLNTQEFSSGVFYRYGSLNIKQLQDNLGGASRKEALEIAKHVLHMMATVVPSAKQQSFAAHNLADFAMVSFGDMPVSLANAFEKPVVAKGDGFLAPSIEKLNEYWQTVHRGYGLDEKVKKFRLGGTGDADTFDELTKLEAWVSADAGENA